MRAATRDAIRQRCGGRCGYCGIGEEEAGAQLTLDHYRPRAHVGSDEDGNLVYSCHACNEHKQDYWSEDTERQIIHPLNENPAEHFVERVDHLLIPLTERGHIPIGVLKLNRLELIASRRRRWRMADEERAIIALQRQFEAMEIQIERLSESIARLTGGIPARGEGVKNV